MSKRKEIHLDGSYLEGGGQLLRLAIGLAALTQTPLRVTSIRANRGGKGGLKLQHLRAVQFLTTAVEAQCHGAEVASKEIRFIPAPAECGQPIIRAKQLPKEIQIGSPGSVCLVIQAILPYLLFAGSQHDLGSTYSPSSPGKIAIKIHGGTNVSNSPSVEYLNHVLIPTLTKIGIPEIQIAFHQRGWSGRGSKIGSVTLNITPLAPRTQLSTWSLIDRGPITRGEVYAIMSKRYKTDIEQETTQQLKEVLGNDVIIETHFDDVPQVSYLLLVAVSENGHRLGRDWLYDGNLKRDQATLPSIMTKKVVAELMTEINHGGCVDHYLRDQLIVFQALAHGKCRIDYGDDENGTLEPSLHARTAAWVTEEILGVRWENNQSCQGIGFSSGGQASSSEVEGITEEGITEAISKIHV